MRTITTLEQLRDLPVETVLLCRLEGVFQLKATTNGENAWYALGYGDRTWKPAEILEYSPLEVIHTPRSNDLDTALAESRLQVLEHAIEAYQGDQYSAPALAVYLLERLDAFDQHTEIAKHTRALEASKGAVDVDAEYSLRVIALRDDIMAERRRQIQVLGFTPEVDRGRATELRLAATCYRDVARDQLRHPVAALAALFIRFTPPAGWPWDEEQWKPSVHVNRNIVRAAALQHAADAAAELLS